MKHNTRKIGLSLLTTLMIAIIGIVISCDKESNTVQQIEEAYNTNMQPQKANKVFGSYDKDKGIYNLNFDQMKFMHQFQTALIDSGLTNLIVEDVSLYDEDPKDIASVSALKISVFDTTSAFGTTFFFPTDKLTINDSVIYSYSNKPEVICTGQDCYNGCWLKKSKDGCTGCKKDPHGRLGHCSSYVHSHGSGNGSSSDIPAWMQVVLAIIQIGLMIK